MNSMWMKGRIKQIRSRWALIVFVGLGVSTVLGCSNPETVLVIENPTDVYSIIQTSSVEDLNMTVQPGNVIATLQAGETARAIGVYHGENHDGFKVKLADGTEGLIFAGDSFRVTSR